MEKRKKILVIRFSSIGDIVLTTPVLRCLHQQTGAEIHYLTKQAYLPLLEANPYVSKIHTIDNKVTEVLPALRKDRYDLIVDLHKNWRSLQTRLGLGVKALTFNKLNFEKWLLVNFKINLLPKVHLVDRYLQAVAPLGVKNDGEGLDYFFPDTQKNHHSPFTIHHSPIAFVIGAKYATKQLPEEKIIAICRGLGAPIALLGGKEEGALGERVAKEAGEQVVNFCGKLTLHESAAAVRDARYVITHDTGMMHIAAAFQQKIVSVWGNTVPDFGMYPYFGSKGTGRFEVVEVKNLHCRPCSKIGYQSCPKGHFRCMREIDVMSDER